MKYFMINKDLWCTEEDHIDKTTWLEPNHNSHGPRMKPGSKSGRLCIAMSMEARNNPETLRTEEVMLKFIKSEMRNVGLAFPEEEDVGGHRLHKLTKDRMKMFLNWRLVNEFDVTF